MKKVTNERRSNYAVIALITVFVLGVITVVFFMVVTNQSSHDKETGNFTSPIPQENITDQEPIITTAVYLGLDDVKNEVQVQVVDSGADLSFSYTMGAKITDKYDQYITASKLVPGQLVQISYDKKKNDLKALKVSNQTWENIGITGVKVNPQVNVISFLGRNYSYRDDLIVLSNGEQISIEDISSTDYLTIRGEQESIYSIVVTRGHGYLELTEEEDFVGGNVYVGTVLMQQIEPDMLITVSEGYYEITVENKTQKETFGVTIKRDQTTQYSLLSFQQEKPKTGKVTFQIQPEMAELYVDKVLTSYVVPVELSYGLHDIEVVLGGYVSYIGTLTVEEPQQIASITLIESSKQEAEQTPIITQPVSVVPTGMVTPQITPEIKDTTKPENDEAQTITICWMSGASVYFNKTYVGTIVDGSLVIEKRIGTFMVDLIMPQEDTVTYQVTIEDDGQDVNLNIPIN